MITNELIDSWAHFEIVDEGGWFKNLLWGKGKWIEVAMVKDGLQLNIGHKDISSKLGIIWPVLEKGIWKVPLSDSVALIDWIDTCFSKAFDVPDDRKLTGWIEG